MLHTFKLYGTRIAVDLESGAVHSMDVVEFDMLRYLEFPIEKNCLSTLRYDLARYESKDVSAAFSRFEKMNKAGVFCSDNPVDSFSSAVDTDAQNVDIVVEYDASRPIFATEVIRAAENGAMKIDLSSVDGAFPKADDMDIVDSELERIAKEVAKRKLGKISGNAFEFLPFTLRVIHDENGYLKIADKDVVDLFKSTVEDGKTLFRRKCAECALMLLSL